MLDVQLMVEKFKMQLLLSAPFYGDIASHLDFREDRSIPTAATNGEVVMINPRFFEPLNEAQRNYVLMHEVMHALLLHPSRMKNRVHSIANTAADMIVNNILDQLAASLQKSGSPLKLERPPAGIFYRVSSTDTFETVYERLKSLQEQYPAPERDKITVYVRNYRGKETRQTVDTASDVIEPILLNGSKGSSAADSQVFSAEDKMRAIVADALRKLGSGGGRSPYGSYPVPQEVYNLGTGMVLNWKSILKRYLNQRADEESSYTTPERKYLHMDLILPGHGESEGSLEEVWTFIDCSGSIGKDATEAFLLQLNAIMKEFKCTLNVVYWDTQVHEVYKDVKTKKEILECVPHFSGGTDINCVYKWIKENKPSIDVMVVLTDGYYGRLRDEYYSPKLKKRTVLVLNTNVQKTEATDRIGKIARLV